MTSDFVLEQLVNLADNLILNGIIFIFLNAAYEPKFVKKSPYIISYFITAVLSFAVNSFFLTVLNFLFTIIKINLLTFALYKPGIKKAITTNLLYILVFLITDIITGIIYSTIMNVSYASFFTKIENIAIPYLINITLFFTINIIFITFIRRRKMYAVSLSHVVLLIIINAFEFFIIILFAQKTSSRSDSVNLMLILVGIFLIDVLITYQTNKLAENNFKLSQLEVIKAQNNLQLAHYEETIIKYDESRKIIHDLRKHINVYADLKTKDEKAATEYACLIDQNINSLVGEFICTNRILSIIMDQKINQAKRDNIDIQLKFSDIPFDFLSDIDITALFANLWDNAIEGANTVTDGAKKIKIVIGEDKGLTVIVFENNYGGKVKRIKSGYLTTKAKGHQGLGLPIINTTVLKHDGHISVSNSDNIFKVSIMFTKENYPPRNNLFTISR